MCNMICKEFSPTQREREGERGERDFRKREREREREREIRIIRGHHEEISVYKLHQ